MEKPQRTDETSDAPSTWDKPKTRRCLRCHTSFASEWSGERICSRCKTSSTWRNGAPPSASALSNGR